MKELGIVQESEEVYEGDEPQKTEGQKQYERGRQLHIKGALETARKIRGRALSIGSYEHVVEQAGAQYDYHCGATQTAGKFIDFAKDTRNYVPFADGAYTVTKARFDHTFGDLSRTGLDAEISRGTQSLAVDGAIALTTLGVGKLVTKAYRGAKTYLASRAAARLAASESTALSKMPACMTQSQNPKVDMFKRVAQDDWYVPQSQTGSRFLEFDARAKGLEKLGLGKQGYA